MSTASALDMKAGLEELDKVKPANAKLAVEKQLYELVPEIIKKIDQGYTVEQYYDTLPTKALEEVGFDKATFIKRLKTIITKYRKDIEKKKAAKKDDPKGAAEADLV